MARSMDVVPGYVRVSHRPTMCVSLSINPASVLPSTHDYVYRACDKTAASGIAPARPKMLSIALVSGRAGVSHLTGAIFGVAIYNAHARATGKRKAGSLKVQRSKFVQQGLSPLLTRKALVLPDYATETTFNA